MEHRRIKRSNTIKEDISKLQTSFFCFQREVVPSLEKSIKTFGAFTQKELKTLFGVEISEQMLYRIVVVALKLDVMMKAICQSLKADDKPYKKNYEIGVIMKVLHHNKIYEFLQSETRTEEIVMLTNKNTQLNIKIITASLLGYASKKINIKTLIMLRSILDRLYFINDKVHGIPLQQRKVVSILNRIGKTMHTYDFKLWVQNFADKNILQQHHFIYLICICQNGNNIPREDQKFQEHLPDLPIINNKINRNIANEQNNEELISEFKVEGVKFNSSWNDFNSNFTNVKKKINTSETLLKRARSGSLKIPKIQYLQKSQSKIKKSIPPIKYHLKIL